jgi:hypothetical protein
MKSTDFTFPAPVSAAVRPFTLSQPVPIGSEPPKWLPAVGEKHPYQQHLEVAFREAVHGMARPPGLFKRSRKMIIAWSVVYWPAVKAPKPPTRGQALAGKVIISEGGKILLRWGGIPILLCDDPADGSLSVIRLAFAKIFDRELAAGPKLA